ncbi:unnamed protein product [Ostreobium quekettii]|uniref:Equilibrative nucleoside transporter n=1 Tax=Ostreobium quekettii TaxID=121088 RepID=A0A8S1IKY2_9CHLO|nr:unnamed protein product [Ostreobium quekettii]|eukprot:evm.model.scf_254EXC.13 EVM.evm.TU.scf_254EXC.13   scf_254EXC:101416-105011(+)
MGGAYLCFVVLGAGVLAPWNAFITAVDYFAKVYPGEHMDRKVTVCYIPALVLTMLLTIRFHNLLSSRFRMLVGFGGFSILLFAVPVVDALFVRDSAAPPVAQYLTLAAVFGTGILDGVAQGAVLGDASYLPGRYQQAFSSGTAASGVLVSLLRVFTKFGFGDSWVGLRRSTMLYFITALAVTSLCFFLAAYVVPRLPTVVYYRDLARAFETGSGVLPMELDVGGDLVVANDGTEDGNLALVPGSQKKADYLHVTYKLRHVIIGLVMIYTVTLTIFPGVVAEDVHSGQLGDWYNVLLVLVYNCGDLGGKSLPAVTGIIRNRLRLMAWCAARFVFLPIFYVAVMIWPDGHPGIMALLVLVLGLSNGFVTSNAFMVAPRGLQGQEVDLSGSLLVFALAIGLLIGAGGGWLWLLAER